MSRNRLSYVDAAKAIAIYFVILGHTVSRSGRIFPFIFGFHMPAFFFFSGYCTGERFYEQPFGAFVKKKAKSLLIPYVAFSLIGLIFVALFADWRNDAGFRYNFQKYVYYAQPISLGSVWFLVCLFVSFLGMYGILKGTDRVTQKKEPAFTALTLAVMVFLGTVGTKLIPKLIIPYYIRLPWKIDSAVVAVVFVLLGYLCRTKAWLEKIPKGVRIAGLVVLPLIVWYTAVLKNGYVNICDCEYSDPVYYFISSVAGTFWLMDLGWVFRKSRCLVWLGQNSLVIFGIHTFPLWIATEIYWKIVGSESHHLPDNLWAVLIPFAVYAVCALIAMGWNYLKRRQKKSSEVQN